MYFVDSMLIPNLLKITIWTFPMSIETVARRINGISFTQLEKNDH